ncbi:MAG: DNA recombination protein RmuC [Erysipelotrichaceae bacterium]
MMNITEIILITIALLSLGLIILLLSRRNGNTELKQMRSDLNDDTQRTIKTFSDFLSNSTLTTNGIMDKRLEELSRILNMNQESLRVSVETRLKAIQEDNAKKLEEMRHTVDEKLQKTLDERISLSFKQVSEQLESVYKSLGEMKSIGIEVGDLKKVLSNVKTKGILGEIQLGSILEQILSPEQYLTDTPTYPGSKERVEFAVKLPGDENGPVLLPIDSKFPTEDFMRLLDAYDTGDKAKVDQALKVLDNTIKGFAKTIHDKYIKAPYTTDFGILFLPTEGLYAEVVRRGLVEDLQRLYKINIAGPTTMAALLNSLQMGFKTLAIQKRSSEVWSVLSAVKTEFQEFSTILQNAQDKLSKTSEDLDKLVGVRTRQINRKLKDVSTLDMGEANLLLEDEPSEH